MAGVFISYRRDDSRGDAGRLYDRLVAVFGKKHIFRDIDAIAPGEHFPVVLDTRLKVSDVVLAVIGPKWLSLRKGGQRRLDDPHDYVRRELATALEREVPVIPVLVGTESMPREKDLPRDLGRLASCQAAILSERHFQRDLDALILEIEAFAGGAKRRHLIPSTPDPKKPWRYRDPDWFAETPHRICPALEITWPDKALPRVRDEHGALTGELRQLLDDVLQRIWQRHGVILPGVCMSRSAGDPGEYVVRVRGWAASRGKYSKALEPALQEIETAVRDDLRYIIGHQEVANLIAVTSPDCWDEIVSKSGRLTDLVLVCRALLAERVSLAAFQAIVPAFVRLYALKRPLVQIVEDVRCLDEVRPLLPGNNDKHSFVALSAPTEREFTRSLDHTASQPVLAVDPEWLQNAFATLAEAFAGLSGEMAMVVSQPAIRPFVSKVIAWQYPRLSVLSRRELLPGLSRRIVQTIDLSGT